MRGQRTAAPIYRGQGIEEPATSTKRVPTKRGQTTPGSGTGSTVVSGVQSVVNRTALAAANALFPAYLTEAGREGVFTWNGSDLSAMVAADAQQGVYVPPTGQNGSAGAWVRHDFGDLQAGWWGLSAAASGSANATAFAAAIAYHLSSGIPLSVPAGIFNHTGAPTVGSNYFNIYGSSWGKTVFKPTSATEGIILRGRYGRLANIGFDGRPDGVTRTGTYGIVARDCNSTIIENCDCRGFVNDGLFLSPGYGGGSPGNNDTLKVKAGSYNLNGGCGIRMEQAADNNNIAFLGINCSSNISHGMLAKSAGGIVDPACLFEGNGGYGIQIGEDTDISVNVNWLIDGPWIEGNTLGGVRGSAQSAANTIIIRIPSAGQTYTGAVAGSDRVIDYAQGLKFGGTGADWVELSASAGAGFVLAKNTSGTGDVDLWLSAQNAGVIRPQNDVDFASGKVVKMNGTQVLGARVTGWTADTGTAEKGAHATYTAPTISNPPTQAEVQAIADALQSFSRGQKAIKDAMLSHGSIGT